MVCAPPMFMSAVKDTEEDVDAKRQKLEESTLPAAPLHDLVPLETSRQKKKEQADMIVEKEAQGETISVVPSVAFEGGNHQSQRVKTRHMLQGLNHSLQKLLGFRFSDTMPTEPLRPIKLGEERLIHKTATGENMVYYWCKETGESVWQSSKANGFPQHLRLASVMDEGSSSYAIIAALAEQCSVLPVRDSMHKLHRVQELAFSGNAILSELRKEIFLCLKMDRAPYSTSRFGRRLKEAAELYANDMEPNDALLGPFLASIGRDMGIDPDDFASIKHAILGFANRHHRGGLSSDYSTGRWDSLFDGAQILLRPGGI